MIFDVKTSEDYFYHIQRSIDKYKLDTSKNIERLFFIINGLNHLREWIAPNYQQFSYVCKQDSKVKKVNEPKNEAEIFSKNIYDLSEYTIIREVCNGIKHLRKQRKTLETSYNLNVDAWPNFDDIQSVDAGAPSDFFVDSINIIEFIEKVTRYYDEKWFHRV